MMKELFLVGAAAGLGGILLGKYGGAVEAKLGAMASFIPLPVVHFTMVGGSAAAVYYIARRVV